MSLITINVNKCWKNIAKFEAREVRAWRGAEPLQKEARASARMAAYVKLMEDQGC